MATAKKKAVTKKLKFKAEEVVESVDFDIDEFVKTAKKVSKEIFVPSSEDDELLQINDWIKMPQAIRKVTGTPGIPCGLISMIYGKKDCGKTTLATETLASCQRDGGIAVLIDTENKYNLKRAAAMGLDVRKLVIVPATTIEDVFDRFIGICSTVKSKPEWAERKIAVVWDSLGGTPSNMEMDDSKGEFAMTAARIIKGGLRKTIRTIKDMKVAFVIINHVYTKSGVTFGKKTTTYGGEGPEYYSALMLEMARVGRIRPKGKKSPDPFCGIKTKISAEKNHMAQPFLDNEIQIDWRGLIEDRSPEYAPEGFYATVADDEVKVDMETGEIV
jgi:RecA/RadA recombinase